MYLFSFSTATVLLLYNTLVSILHSTFGMFSVQSNYYHQWQFFCNKKFILQENNRYKTYERKSRILERKVSIISHGSNSEPQMSHRMSLIVHTSIVWILLCIQAYALPQNRLHWALPSAIEAV